MMVKLYYIMSLAMVALATDLSSNEFLSVLLADVKSNSIDYIAYYITGSIPSNIMALAQEARTYDGTDYSSLLSANTVDISSLESFADSLPWSTRLAAAESTATAGTTNTGSGSVTATTTNSNSGAKSTSTTSSSTTASSSSNGSTSVKAISFFMVSVGIAASLL